MKVINPVLMLAALLLGLHLPSCLTPSETFSVDAEVTFGLLDYVEVRTDVLVGDWNEVALTTEYEAAKQRLMAFRDVARIPATMADDVNFICNVHDALIASDPRVDPFLLNSYLRTTTLLRELFQVAAEPIFLPGFSSPPIPE